MIEFFIRAFAGVFVIMDPLGGSTHFLALTPHESAKARQAIALKACTVCCAILIFFALSGNALFHYFGITLAALKIAGGILLFTVALAMLHGKRPGTKTSPEEEKDYGNIEDIAIIPLAIPLLSGPGAITTVMVLAAEATSLLKIIMVIAAILISGLAGYLILLNSEFLKRVLRETGIKILTRIMGLIMSVIAIQFVINGISDIMPLLFD